jgi:hypothetical protein
MSNQGAWKLTPLTPCSVERVVRELDAAFSRINPNHKQVKSPAEQFSESHREWLKNGREA